MPKKTTNIKIPKIVFFGSSQSSAVILQDLIDSKRYEVVAVVTQPEKPHSHTSSRQSAVSRLAETHHIPVLAPTRLVEITDQLKKLEPKVGVLFSYGKILPNETISLFNYGIVNIHPSLLPKHRGPSPLESTILAGDTRAGTSIMLISQEMDAGPILAQKSFGIAKHIAKQELWDKLMIANRKLIMPALDKYLAGVIKPRPQSKSLDPSYSRMIKKTDGDIDLTTISAVELERAIRAYSGWPGVRIPIIWHQKPAALTIHSARLHELSGEQTARLICRDKKLLLALADGCLELLEVQLPGRKIITGRDFCNTGDFSLDTA